MPVEKVGAGQTGGTRKRKEVALTMKLPRTDSFKSGVPRDVFRAPAAEPCVGGIGGAAEGKMRLHSQFQTRWKKG